MKVISMFKRIMLFLNKISIKKLREKATQIRWVYQYARKQFPWIVLYMVMGVSGTVVSLISGLVSRDLVDIITGHRAGELIKTFAIMIGVTLGSMLIGQSSSYISTKINLKIENYIKAEIFDQMMATEWEELAKYHSGDLIARWNGDVAVISNSILNLIPNTVIYVFQFFSALYMVIKYDASFAIFALLSIPISMIISRESLKRVRKGNMSSLAVNSKISSFNNEAFSNVQLLKAFDMLTLYSRKLRELQREYAEVRLSYQRVTIMNSIILLIVSMLVTYSAQAWGVYKVWSGAITYGTMTMFLTLSSTLSGTVNNLINLAPNTISFMNSSKRLMEIVNLPKEDFSKNEMVKKFYEDHCKIGVGLHLHGISCAYGQGENVFSEVNFDANPHEIIAIVGPSGEGKTTMMRYLLSLLRTRSGSGYLCAGDSMPNDNQCIELSASIRQLIAYVPQGNTMFAGTISSNMRNVKEDATEEDMINALKVACAWDFVEKLPDGLENAILERGGGFSEGQSQRLAIARAVLRKSPILLLDEATSALDIMTEKRVLSNIMRDDYPRTTIVTTHRPSVLRMCHRVYAIRGGRCDLMTTDEIEELLEM